MTPHQSQPHVPEPRNEAPEGPIVREVRARAEAISKRYNDDLRTYASHLLELQESQRHRVVDQPRIVSSAPSNSKPAA